MVPYNLILQPVQGHRPPPLDFLAIVRALVTGPDDLFLPNSAKEDIYAELRPLLAPGETGWPGMLYRRAAMAAGLVTHAALESDYKWLEGKDPNNHNPAPSSWEAGVFQASMDSEYLDPSLRLWLVANNIHNPPQFADFMKSQHAACIEYAARLYRVSTRWAGPWNRGEVQKHLSIPAYHEWVDIIADAGFAKPAAT